MQKTLPRGRHGGRKYRAYGTVIGEMIIIFVRATRDFLDVCFCSRYTKVTISRLNGGKKNWKDFLFLCWIHSMWFFRQERSRLKKYPCNCAYSTYDLRVLFIRKTNLISFVLSSPRLFPCTTLMSFVFDNFTPTCAIRSCTIQ